MRREIAITLLESLQKLGPGVDRVFDLTEQIEDEAERIAFRQHLAEAIHALGYELVMHIVRQYPDLDPDK